ncbi:NADH-quinone oxidoreductase subunit I [Arcobacter sp. 31_11_sub10_T18]|nr:NADH-quinone oxidoreductase subunit I [Arcobacter sp. 31_11_sub10_T18]
MSKIDLNERNVGSKEYIMVQEDTYPKTSWQEFKQVVKRSVKGELLTGLKITFVMMKEALFNKNMHTVQYPAEKLPISARFRGMHKLLALLESGDNRCISCGLCEKICISNCIRIDSRVDENSRKEVLDYYINLGRCIFCGYCAEVCPELAIVHGPRYEVAGEQRAHFIDMEDLLTPIDKLVSQEEYPGFGDISPNADERMKKTPLSY